MKRIVGLLIVLCVLLVVACQKYVDKTATADPRLTNHYCNDPNAVNYNWGFPGKPDNTVCFYPNGEFVGKYVYYDTVYQLDLSKSYSRIDTLYIYSSSYTALQVLGFCSAGDTMHLTAGKTLVATVDTTIITGQQFCRAVDTVSGTITKNLADTLPLLHVYFTVVSDTGTTFHIGYAQKL